MNLEDAQKMDLKQRARGFCFWIWRRVWRPILQAKVHSTWWLDVEVDLEMNN
jgi:hypothetical protein